jgi:putative ABC transport system permease protein
LAVLSAALAAMGTYGLVSFAVTQRTHEIGIRMALGVSPMLASVLFGVSATDAVSFARALLIVLGGVSAATIVPAWRASRTNPLTALRHQQLRLRRRDCTNVAGTENRICFGQSAAP